MSTESLAIGVDIGGTKIAFALVDAGGRVLESLRAPTNAPDGPDAVMDTVATGIQTLQVAAGERPVTGAGIGCPGHVDAATGIARGAVNLGWTEVALRDGVAARLDTQLPLYTENDVRAAAVGEMRFGVARGVRDLIFLGVGTGLGGAAVSDGRLVRGGAGLAMEVGQIVRFPDWPGDENVRLYEHLVSGGGLVTLAGLLRGDHPSTALPPDASTHAILTAAEAGDPLALAAVRALGDWLGRSVVWAAAVLNPALVVIGGGLGVAAGRWLVPAVEDAIRTYSWGPVAESTRVAVSALDDPALGAASLVWQG